MEWMRYLPPRLREELRQKDLPGEVGELHLRAGRPASVTVRGENLWLGFRATPEELRELLAACCGGSLYAFRESIRQGFVPLPGGVRLGVCGRAVTEDTQVTAVTDVTSLCFRIPHRVAGVSDAAYTAWEQRGRRCGVLVIAPPAGGKTTFLRDFLIRASRGARGLRVAVVDTREELCPDSEGDLVDVLRGYPRGAGLEIALRTLSPEVLVCDEIGAEETPAVLACLHGGVPLIASIHGTSPTEVHARPGAGALLDCGAFGLAVTLLREGAAFRAAVQELPC